MPRTVDDYPNIVENSKTPLKTLVSTGNNRSKGVCSRRVCRLNVECSYIFLTTKDILGCGQIYFTIHQITIFIRK